MAPIRAFIALPLPDDIRERLGALRRAAPAGAPVRWVAPASIHLTLKFLGEVEPERVEEVRAALAGFAWERGRFGYTLAEVGGFPNLRRPRVIWVGVTEGAEILIEMAARVEALAARLGFPREERRFTPHLTIGRVNGAGAPGWAERFAQAARLEPLEVRPSEVVLFQSKLLPSGAQHTHLLDVPL